MQTVHIQFVRMFWHILLTSNRAGQVWYVNVCVEQRFITSCCVNNERYDLFREVRCKRTGTCCFWSTHTIGSCLKYRICKTNIVHDKYKRILGAAVMRGPRRKKQHFDSFMFNDYNEVPNQVGSQSVQGVFWVSSSRRGESILIFSKYYSVYYRVVVLASE